MFVFASLSDAANILNLPPSSPFIVNAGTGAAISISVSPTLAAGTYSGSWMPCSAAIKRARNSIAVLRSCPTC